MSNLPTVVEVEEAPSSAFTGVKHDKSDESRHQYLATPHARTTKDLVSTFEARSWIPPAALIPAESPRRLHRAPTLEVTKPSSPLREKPQSSLKRSWQNLLDIVKKDITSQHCTPTIPKKPNSSTAHNTAPGLHCDSELPTGTLLLYSAAEDYFSIHIGTLENHSIILSSSLAPGTPTRRISLAGCHDVCSRSLGDLDVRRREALSQAPSMGGKEPKVFELMYADGKAELLGVGSVKERAAWVSAIWGTILGSTKEFSFAGAHPPNLRFKDPVPGDLANTKKPTNSALVSFGNSHGPAHTPVPLHATLVLPHDYSNGPTLPARRSEFEYDLPLTGASPPALPPKDGTALSSSVHTLKPPQERIGLDASHKRPSVAALFKRSSVKDRINSINTENTTSLPTRQPKVFLRPASHVSTNAKSTSGTRSSATSSTETDYSDVDSLLDSYRHTPLSHCSDTTNSTLPLQVSEHHNVNSLEEHILQVREEVTRISQAVERLSQPSPPAVANQDLNLVLSRELDLFKDEMRSGFRDLCNSVHMAQNKTAEVSRNYGDRVLEDIKAAIEKRSIEDDQTPEAILGQELLRVAQTVGDIRFSMGEEIQRLVQVCTSSTDHSAKIMSTLDITLPKIVEMIAAQNDGTRAASVDTPQHQLTQIMEMTRQSASTTESVQEQQSENGKYLAQMCAWMDAFVKYNTSKQEDISAMVGQLLTQSNISGPNEDSTRGLAITFPSQANNVGLDLKNLIETVHSRLGADAQARDSLYHALCQQLPARQWHDQSELLRNLGADLSAEIKGEQLRFVDAMKEATTLNVSYHVEEFKSHLTREVHTMTQDVLRLQQEKDMLERRVGELKHRRVES